MAFSLTLLNDYPLFQVVGQIVWSLVVIGFQVDRRRFISINMACIEFFNEVMVMTSSLLMLLYAIGDIEDGILVN